jgi:dimethylhistidine N-methyltransferase
MSEPPAIASAVRAGLTANPKRLPPWLFYDDRGSALFDAITRLPEYYLTRTELAILERHAPAIVDAAGAPTSVVELGAGSAPKTGVLLEAVKGRRADATYVPVDVSRGALAVALRRLALAFPRLVIRPVVARYPEQLAFLNTVPGPRLVLFLGSSIGNYEPAAATALLAAVRRRLAPGDAVLLGTDLRKSAALLEPAYDDAAGVTAEFNKNLLVRINRELGGAFDPDAFRHRATWNRFASRIEMYLESRSDQTVAISHLGLHVRFARSERIHTENSYKFTRARIRDIVTAAGLHPERSWLDERRWFALHLLRA